MAYGEWVRSAGAVVAAQRGDAPCEDGSTSLRSCLLPGRRCRYCECDQGSTVGGSQVRCDFRATASTRERICGGSSGATRFSRMHHIGIFIRICHMRTPAMHAAMHMHQPPSMHKPVMRPRTVYAGRAVRCTTHEHRNHNTSTKQDALLTAHTISSPAYCDGAPSSRSAQALYTGTARNGSEPQPVWYGLRACFLTSNTCRRPAP